MLTLYDLDNPRHLKTVLHAVLQDKGVQDIRYQNVSAGQDVTYLVNDEWIVKLGLNDEDYYKFDDQRDLMSVIRPYIRSVQLPAYEAQDFKGVFSEGAPFWIHAARYQKMRGVMLNDFDDLKQLPDKNREQIMKSLARFTAELHSIPLAVVTEFFPNNPFEHIRQCIARCLPKFNEMEEYSQDLLTSNVMKSVYKEENFCLCHRDLRPQNFCLNEKKDAVINVFDFGCAGIDLPQRDVQAFITDEKDKGVFEQEYERLTGRKLNSYREHQPHPVGHQRQSLAVRVQKALLERQYL